MNTVTTNPSVADSFWDIALSKDMSEHEFYVIDAVNHANRTTCTVSRELLFEAVIEMRKGNEGYALEFAMDALRDHLLVEVGLSERLLELAADGHERWTRIVDAVVSADPVSSNIAEVVRLLS